MSTVIIVRQEQENVLRAQLVTSVLLVVRNLRLVRMGITVLLRKMCAKFAPQVIAVSWLMHHRSSVQLGATHRQDS